MTHISTITFPFSLFETLLNKPSKNLSKSKFSRYTTKIRGKLNFKLNFCKYFYRFRIQTKKKIRADRKKRKEKKRRRIEHPLVFDPQRKRTSRAHRSTQPPPPRSLPAFVQVAQKLLELFFIAKLAPLPSTLSLWRGSSIEIPFLPPSLPLPLARLPWKREVGGRGLDKFLANKERL